MIKTFRCNQTERLFLREGVSKFSGDVCRRALRKLLLSDAAEKLEDLRMPPGNQLEKLVGPACLDFGLHADRRILYSTARYRSMAIQVSAETFREMPCRVRGAHTAFYEASICPGEGAEQIQACSLPRFQSTPRRIAFPIGLAPVIWRVIRFVRHLPGRLRS